MREIWPPLCEAEEARRNYVGCQAARRGMFYAYTYILTKRDVAGNIQQRGRRKKTKQ